MVPKLIDFKELFEKKIFNKEFPKHVCVNTTSFRKDKEEAAEKHMSLIKMLLDWQVKSDLPILTINLGQAKEEYKVYLTGFLKSLLDEEIIHKNQTRIIVIGKWYDLDQENIELIKQVMEKTKDYDKFFLNLCICYDGQEEIVSALKLMARKIDAKKLGFEEISKEVIKDNIYTSYFIPPELMIEAGFRFSGTLLWDCADAVIHFTRKDWLELEKKDLELAVEMFNKAKTL